MVLPWARVVPLAVLASVAMSAAAARADSAPSDAVEGEVESPPAGRRALSVGAALLPGVAVHGSGLYTLGDESGARGVLAMQGAGLAMMVAGGVPLALTGAARDITWPAVPLVVSGAGLFAASWLADLYGISGLSSWAQEPRDRARFELETSYAYVRDLLFDYGHFSVVQARLRAGAYQLEPSAWVALDADNQRFRLETRRRLWDPDGQGLTYLEAVGAVTWHRYGDDAFSSRLGELSVGGRLDLGRLSANLRGSYFDLGTGAGLEWLRFDLAEEDENDLTALLLGTFAIGARLGRADVFAADIRLAYDHRRDDFAAGLSTSTRGSGFAGHVGASAHLMRGAWGVRLESWFGAAHVYRLGVTRRFGDRP